MKHPKSPTDDVTNKDYLSSDRANYLNGTIDKKAKRLEIAAQFQSAMMASGQLAANLNDYQTSKIALEMAETLMKLNDERPV